MILFFGNPSSKVIAVQVATELSAENINKLNWLFGNQPQINTASIDAFFIGPRAAMITPWSTNAVEITQNMGIKGMIRIEQFTPLQAGETIDPMVSERFENLDQNLFTVEISPEPIREIDNISAYNFEEGLSLNPDEIRYLEQLAVQLDRPLTDSEVFGFSQVNSEHCRHKIFNEHFTLTGSNKKTRYFP